MIFELLFQEPAVFFGIIFALLLSITVHEFSHALVATLLGDATPRYEGRLTLNPMAHLDPLGTLLLIFVGFGWGKPVPFNPYNLRFKRFGPALVSLAGPFANLVLIIVFLLLSALFAVIGVANPAFNELFSLVIFLNIVLMIFNLIPIAPLDGSKVLFAFLPERLHFVREFLERYGPIALLILVIADNFLGLQILSRLIEGGVGFVSRFLFT